MQRQLAISLIVLVIGGSESTARAQQPSPLEPTAPAAVPRSATLTRLLPATDTEEFGTSFTDLESEPIVTFWRGRVRLERFGRPGGSSGLFSAPSSSWLFPDPVQAVSLAWYRDERYGMGVWLRWGEGAEAEPTAVPASCESWRARSRSDCGPYGQSR